MAGWFNWKIEWNGFTPGRLVEWLGETRAAQVQRTVERSADRYSKKIEEWMRANAPWTDQTGDARRELRAEVLDITGKAVLILLRHGVDYGVYLETVAGGSYAILGRTLDTWAPVIWRDLQVELTTGTMILDEG